MMPALHQIARRIALLVLLNGVTSGCGEAEAPGGRIDGRLTVGGKPLGNAVVGFISRRTRDSAMVPVDEDGRFTIDYLAPNRYTVYVTPIPAISPDETPAAPTEGIPEKYQSETTSDADFMILPGTNTLTIDLKP